MSAIVYLKVGRVSFMCNNSISNSTRRWQQQCNNLEGKDHTTLAIQIPYKCEGVVIANCDFSPCAQLLERNV